MVNDGRRWPTMVNKKEKELRKEDSKICFMHEDLARTSMEYIFKKNSRKLKVEVSIGKREEEGGRST